MQLAAGSVTRFFGRPSVLPSRCGSVLIGGCRCCSGGGGKFRADPAEPPQLKRGFGSAVPSTATISKTSTGTTAFESSAPIQTAPAVVPKASDSESLDLSPYCLDLRGLIRRLQDELPAQPPRGAPIDKEVLERVSEMLRRTKLNPREWRQHAVHRRGRYTRNIVGYSPGQFVALILCWERGQQSPIHDHSGAHCFVKMLTGRLREQRFEWSDDRQAAKPDMIEELMMESKVEAESVGFAHDSLGLHRIINPDTEEVAVSLHIYSPPFENCLVFPPTGATAVRSPMVSINAPTMGSADEQARLVPSALPRSGVPPPPSLRDLCGSLERLGADLGYSPDPTSDESAYAPAMPDPSTILDLLGPVELEPLEWGKMASPAHFSDFHCVQNLIHCDEHFSVMVSCWSPGQSMPPYAAGRGRREWVKVLHGGLTYKEFASGLFWHEVEVESQMPEGSASVLSNSTKVRSLANSSESSPAVSIHVFSPPLTQFAYRTEKGIERRDVPALLGLLSQTIREGVQQAGGISVENMPKVPVHESATLRGLMRTAGRKFLSFRSLAKLLNEELARPESSDDAITTLLRKAIFNAEEWRGLASSALLPDGKSADECPRAVRIPTSGNYMLEVCYWASNDQRRSLAEERTGGRSWTLVLEGELEERAYDARARQATNETDAQRKRRLHRISTLKEESVSFITGDEDIHLSCSSEEACVSLHIFSPPSSSRG